MKPLSHKDRRSRGSTITVVLGFTVIGAMAAGTVAFSTTNRLLQARKQLELEQAFYLAEAGAERAVSRIADGNEDAGTLTGNLGNGSYSAIIGTVNLVGGEIQFQVASTGVVNNIRRGVVMKGVRRVSWARYALWYDKEAVKLWMFPDEYFDGPVYSRPQFHFHDLGLPTKKQVRFYDSAWSVATTIEKASSSVNPIFDKGIRLNVPVESMSSIDFTQLKANASLVLDGATTIVVNNQTMTITNSRKGWSNYSMAVPASPALIYVRTATSGSSGTTADLTVSAPNGLGDRLTLVAENDIKIVNHVRYKNNPKTVPTSTDALGLIAKRNVSIQTSAPNNLDVYAHIICQTGGFGVVNYNEGSARGTLNVYGGIVNETRNGVNTGGGSTGYAKNYVFDKRFTKNPPPLYPVLTDELEWSEWQG